MVIDLEYMAGLVPVILRYVPLTLEMAVISMAIALVLAAALAIVRVLKVPVLDRIVAAVSGPGPRAHRVWLPPLPARTALADAADSSLAPLTASVGLVDRPLEQRQDPFLVDLSGTGGHAAIVGAPRSGKSTAVRTMVASLALTTPARKLHVHVIDYGAGGLSDLAALPHVASVTHRGDADKLNRVVSAVAGEVAAREERHRRKGWHTIADARDGGEPDVLRQGRGSLADIGLG